jgi:SAM-dependent methyltransferase
MPSLYDDELWGLVADDGVPPPAHLVRFVEGLGRSAAALDLGCGDGRLSTWLGADRLVLADVSDVALERARRRLPGVEAVPLTPDAPLPLPDNAFDVVLCAETVEHVRDVQLLLSEVRRVLKPGGRLALTTPAHSRFVGVDIVLRGLERRFPPLSPHLRFFTRRSLEGLLDDLGFSCERIDRERATLLAIARR